ncbi:MAG: signal peptidase I [Deltaproteobacteria bacterium]|nr:signal peptidase I [Deltaproteobacteria bacterium]
MKQTPQKNIFQTVAEYVQALFGAIMLAILIRGFVVEPFRIPSESMVPTLLVGDHIFVARYKYGLRAPFTKLWLAEFDDPERGDVVVFNFPLDEDVDYIKRVVGVPGDTVSMKKGQLFLNGKPISEKPFYVTNTLEDDQCNAELTPESEQLLPEDLKPFPYYLKQKKFNKSLEYFPGDQVHMIQHSIEEPNTMEFERVVPPRHFFVMGDNRDHSSDSRFWDFVPRENLKGKAVFIWLSLDNEKKSCAYNFYDPGIFPNIRWSRFGREII